MARLFSEINEVPWTVEGGALRTPLGTFWVPELAGLNKHDIHDPSALGGLFGVADYPRPIVDLARSRERALQAFKNLPSLEVADV